MLTVCNIDTLQPVKSYKLDEVPSEDSFGCLPLICAAEILTCLSLDCLHSFDCLQQEGKLADSLQQLSCSETMHAAMCTL